MMIFGLANRFQAVTLQFFVRPLFIIDSGEIISAHLIQYVLEKSSSSSKGSLHVMQVHLDRQNSIAQFIKEFKNTYTSLDALINNAAIVPQEREVQTKVSPLRLQHQR